MNYEAHSAAGCRSPCPPAGLPRDAADEPRGRRKLGMPRFRWGATSGFLGLRSPSCPRKEGSRLHQRAWGREGILAPNGRRAVADHQFQLRNTEGASPRAHSSSATASWTRRASTRPSSGIATVASRATSSTEAPTTSTSRPWPSCGRSRTPLLRNGHGNVPWGCGATPARRQPPTGPSGVPTKSPVPTEARS